MRVLLTGGGSGGHIFPLIAVAQKLKQQNAEVQLRYFGPKDVYAGYLIKEGIEIKHIASAKLRRYFSLANFIDGPKFIFSIFQALFKVLWFWPNVAFSKGGPGALPVLLACRFYRVPIIIHESDSVPGLTNSVAGKFAKKIEVSYESTKKYFPGKNIRVVGNPIRGELLEGISLDPTAAKERLELDTSLPLVLVVGGSLGSTRINDFILGSLPLLLKKVQVMHQVGSANYDLYKQNYNFISKKWPAEVKKNYQFLAFFEKNYKDILAASDIIISRSGGTIFEIAAFGKPSILIPLPESANDHQKKNAYEYSETGAAYVVEENNLLPNVVMGIVEKIINNPDLQHQMCQAALKFAKPEAAQLIAEDIINLRHRKA